MAKKPTDDAGASTADAYDWQAAMAAADGLSLYLRALDADGQLAPDDECRIVCEHHEDWVVVQAGDAELVSAKHKESSYGAYTTVNQLMSDGGLAHLFTRWHTMEEKPTCRLVTTPGLARGNCQDLDRAVVYLRDQRLAGESLSIDGDHEMAVTGFAKALLRHPDGLPADWQTDSGESGSLPSMQQRQQVGRFLSILTIQHSSPTRAYVGHAAPSMYVKPILGRLGHTTSPPEAVWEAVIALFRARMRAAGPRPTGALPPVMAYRPGTPRPGPAEMERDLVSRIVTLGDVDLAARNAIEQPAGYLPLRRVPRTSRMAIKMATGRCTDNSIERAEHLRLDYRGYWRTRGNGDPTAAAEQKRLLRVLLGISDQATTTAAASPALAWGPTLWNEVQARIEAMPTAQVPDGMDADLLLGGICELANRCQVWFSDRFDIEAEIARIRARRGTIS